MQAYMSVYVHLHAHELHSHRDASMFQVKIEAVKQKIRHALVLTQMKPSKVAMQAELLGDMRQLGEKILHSTNTNICTSCHVWNKSAFHRFYRRLSKRSRYCFRVLEFMCIFINICIYRHTLYARVFGKARFFASESVSLSSTRAPEACGHNQHKGLRIPHGTHKHDLCCFDLSSGESCVLCHYITL
jgi:hypothetical protein